MDADRVDTLSRAVNNRSRRGAVQALGALGVAGLASRLGLQTSSAKKKRKKKDDDKQSDCPTCPTCPEATTCPACAAGLELRQNGTCARKATGSGACLGSAGCIALDAAVEGEEQVSQFCVADVTCTKLATTCTSPSECPKGSICVFAGLLGCPVNEPLYRCVAVCGA
jgi:hypothetical protein